MRRDGASLELIRARIQHTASRAHLLPALLDALAPLPTEVIEHTSQPTSPWAGYQRCIADPPDCTHLLIIQDDAMPCPNFAQALEVISRENDVPVCLFLGRLPRDTKPRVEQAMKMNRRYVALSQRSFLPIVAVLWPIPKLAEFQEWVDENPGLPGQREPRSDDAMGGRWKMITKQTVRATVPSLVQHPDIEPSTISRAAGGGRDRGRVAAFLADDAMAYDWTAP